MFVPIPAGAFLMGSAVGREDERPVHEVWVDGFDMAVHPVTRQEYARFLEATGHEPPRDWTLAAFGHPEQPVVGVSWFDAVAYCAWESRPGRPVRLPTEAEWERAARGGHEGELFPWGDQIPDWVPNGGRGPLASPWPVSMAPPNRFGLVGIGANIHEWCADWYAAGYYHDSPDRNPIGPSDGVRRASRGGAWRHALTISRTSARSAIDPAFRYNDYGFRIVRPLGS
jgi:iron(II)-dependent oxidoreductase